MPIFETYRKTVVEDKRERNLVEFRKIKDGQWFIRTSDGGTMERLYMKMQELGGKNHIDIHGIPGLCDNADLVMPVGITISIKDLST